MKGRLLQPVSQTGSCSLGITAEVRTFDSQHWIAEVGLWKPSLIREISFVMTEIKRRYHLAAVAPDVEQVAH